MKKAFIFVIIAITVFISGNFKSIGQNIKINEIMSSNGSFHADEDGDYEDWVELYNAGSEPVNLEGYGLSDDISEPLKWTLPSVTLEPDDYLLIWASGKDRKPSVEEIIYRNGLKRDVYTNITGTAVSDLWNDPKYPDNPEFTEILDGLFDAPVDVADYYGQHIYGYVKAPQTGNYTFWIASDDNGKLFLSSSTSPEDTTLIANVWDWTSHLQWDKHPEQQSEPISLAKDQYYFISAFMKEDQGGDNLSVGWRMPDNTLQRPVSGEYLYTVTSEYHTNFKINNGQEGVFLNDPQGNIIDSIPAITLPLDISYGKFPDGSSQNVFFNEPTPENPNNTEPFYSILEEPVASASAGFYANEFELIISHTDPEANIYYTTDGSDPDTSNLQGTTYPYKNKYPRDPDDQTGDLLYKNFTTHQYTSPINIYDPSDEPNRISDISTSFDHHPWYLPSYPVKKGMVVKTIASKSGHLPSPISTNSYFMNNEGLNTNELPVISLTTQEDGLFNYYNGIYVAGYEFDKWREEHPLSEANGGTQANYHLRGRITEKRTHFEFFEPGESVPTLKQDVGIRIHGGFSRSYPMKSIRVYARNSYGKGDMEYQFFKDLPYESYDVLILRNSGNDYFKTLLRDAVIQKTVSHLDIGTQSYQPAIVYINGEYWGIHNIRERMDDKYLERVYGVDRNNIDLIQNYGLVSEGSIDHYNEIFNFIENNTLSNPDNYDHITTQIDISCFIDYQIANIYASNTDWPGNNIKYWRLRTPEYIPDAPKGHDGRWRWLLYDTDFGFSLYNDSYNHNTLQFATQENGPGWPNPDWSTLFLRKLLENEQFRNRFINRFADLLNTAFLPDRVKALINNAKEDIEDEMPNQQQRWTQPAGNMSEWENNINRMLRFADYRPEYQFSHIRDQFDIDHEINLTADVNLPAAGKIRVNSIMIDPQTPGIHSNPYPWQGAYFEGIPVQVEAIPAPGYAFSHWEGHSSASQAVINITPSSDIHLKAHFIQIDESVLVHYWHFNSLNDEVTEVVSDYSSFGNPFIRYPGTGDGYMDERKHRDQDPVSNLNLQMEQQPDQGAVLRARNPSDTRELIFETPSSGYKDLQFRYATTRTNNGATMQTLFYSLNDGENWIEALPSYETKILPIWELKTFDLADVPQADHNPDLKFKITFQGENASLASGNNRFDNITLSGIPLTSNINSHLSNNQSFKIYPIPAKDFIYLIPETNSTTILQQVKIFSLDGKVVMNLQAEKSMDKISVDHLEPGVYILQLSTSDGKLIKKLVIKH